MRFFISVFLFNLQFCKFNLVEPSICFSFTFIDSCESRLRLCFSFWSLILSMNICWKSFPTFFPMIWPDHVRTIGGQHYCICRTKWIQKNWWENSNLSWKVFFNFLCLKCMEWTWYLSVDWQMVLFAPLVIYPALKLGKRVLVTFLTSLVAFSMWIAYSVALENNFQFNTVKM